MRVSGSPLTSMVKASAVKFTSTRPPNHPALQPFGTQQPIARWCVPTSWPPHGLLGSIVAKFVFETTCSFRTSHIESSMSRYQSHQHAAHINSKVARLVELCSAQSVGDGNCWLPTSERTTTADPHVPCRMRAPRATGETGALPAHQPLPTPQRGYACGCRRVSEATNKSEDKEFVIERETLQRSGKAPRVRNAIR